MPIPDHHTCGYPGPMKGRPSDCQACWNEAAANLKSWEDIPFDGPYTISKRSQPYAVCYCPGCVKWRGAEEENDPF
jgi:hypothetical protein